MSWLIGVRREQALRNVMRKPAVEADQAAMRYRAEYAALAGMQKP
ncbi:MULTISPECIES: hypothetical protein [Aquitalea]|nr:MULTISPECIES: hypothetical protein [Aquitalea]